MTDIAKLRGLTHQYAFDADEEMTVLSAADELEALRERCEKLRAAHISKGDTWHFCRLCVGTDGWGWAPGKPEKHADGCLAAPEAAR